MVAARRTSTISAYEEPKAAKQAVAWQEKTEPTKESGWLARAAATFKRSTVDLLVFIADAQTKLALSFYALLAFALFIFTLIQSGQLIAKFLDRPTNTEVTPVTRAALQLPNSTLCLALLPEPLRQSSTLNFSWADAEPLLLELLQRDTSRQLFGTECPWIPEASCVDECRDCTYSQCHLERGLVYHGTKNTTKTGRTCQNWLSTEPHEILLEKIGDIDERFFFVIEDGLVADMPWEASMLLLGDHNYCRVIPAHGFGPGCYTTDLEMVFEACFDDCVAKEMASEPCVYEELDCADWDNPKCRGVAAYEGNRSTTSTGVTCQAWNETSPHYHTRTYVGEHNFCRNPDQEPGPWCYTTNPLIRWATCFEPCATVDCVADGCAQMGTSACMRQALYNQRQTVSARQCQKWSSQSPHEHSRNIGDHNYCANPDAEDGPWCYTTDPNVRWQYCYDSCPVIRQGRILLATTADLIRHMWYLSRFTVNPRSELQLLSQSKYIGENMSEDPDLRAKYRMMEAVLEHYSYGMEYVDLTHMVKRFTKELCRAAGLSIRYWRSQVERAQLFICEDEWLENGVYLSNIEKGVACYHLPLATIGTFNNRDQKVEIGVSLGLLYHDWPAFEESWHESERAKDGDLAMTLELSDILQSSSNTIPLAPTRLQTVTVDLTELYKIDHKKTACDNSTVRVNWQSATSCLDDCHAGALLAATQLGGVCVPLGGRIGAGERHCTDADFDTSRSYLDTHMLGLRAACVDGCLPPCMRAVYRAHLRKNRVSHQQISKRQQLAVFELSFNSFAYTLFAEMPSMSFGTLLSEFGGTIGLYLNCGIGTIVHLAMLVIAAAANRH